MRECSLGLSKMLSNILCQNALLIKCCFHEEQFFRRAFCQRLWESIFERAKEHSCKIDFCRKVLSGCLEKVALGNSLGQLFPDNHCGLSTVYTIRSSRYTVNSPMCLFRCTWCSWPPGYIQGRRPGRGCWRGGSSLLTEPRTGQSAPAAGTAPSRIQHHTYELHIFFITVPDCSACPPYASAPPGTGCYSRRPPCTCCTYSLSPRAEARRNGHSSRTSRLPWRTVQF